jgi:hypothetical protein
VGMGAISASFAFPACARFSVKCDTTIGATVRAGGYVGVNDKASRILGQGS